jgi:diguanylate cyclase (GGDEF)-like protein
MLAPSMPPEEAERIIDLLDARILETPIQEGFERITRLAKTLFNVPIVAISLVEERRQWFKSIQGLNVCETSRDVSFCGHAILQDDLFLVPDTLLDPRFSDNPLVTGDPHIRFYAGYPIRSPRGFKYGTICLIDHMPREFTLDDLKPLKDIANLIETEIMKQNSCRAQEILIQDLDQARLASMIDPLTRLWNRVGMENILHNQMNVFTQTRKPFGIALLDIDHFKSINDTFGHGVGDAALRCVSKSLVGMVRDKDALSRWGGEEFLLLINDATKSQAHTIAERIRAKFEQNRIMLDEIRSVNITLTVGLATCSRNSPTNQLENLIQQADEALYKGKRTGRNKVVDF